MVSLSRGCGRRIFAARYSASPEGFRCFFEKLIDALKNEISIANQEICLDEMKPSHVPIIVSAPFLAPFLSTGKENARADSGRA
jgi:hypothetical protein